MAKKGSNLNPIAGYRTSWSMKSPETWVAANRYSGKAMLLTGITTLFCGFLVWLEPLAQYGWLIVTAVMTLGIVITIAATEKYLRRSFDEDGNPKASIPTLAANPERTSLPIQSSANPPARLPFSALDWIFEALAWLGIILGLAAVIIYYPDLPAKIPQHYGAGGQVDAWGGKSLVFMLPVVGLVLYGFMTMLRWLSPTAGSKKISTRQWRLSIDLINWLKAITVWTFTYLNWMTLQIGLGRAQALHPTFNPIMLGSMTLIMLFYIWKIMQAAE